MGGSRWRGVGGGPAEAPGARGVTQERQKVFFVPGCGKALQRVLFTVPPEDRRLMCVQVYNVHYSMSINGKVEDGSMEIDTANNMERFSTSSGAEEAVEVHDFEIVSESN